MGRLPPPRQLPPASHPVLASCPSAFFNADLTPFNATSAAGRKWRADALANPVANLRLRTVVDTGPDIFGALPALLRRLTRPAVIHIDSLYLPTPARASAAVDVLLTALEEEAAAGGNVLARSAIVFSNVGDSGLALAPGPDGVAGSGVGVQCPSPRAPAGPPPHIRPGAIPVTTRRSTVNTLGLVDSACWTPLQRLIAGVCARNAVVGAAVAPPPPPPTTAAAGAPAAAAPATPPLPLDVISLRDYVWVAPPVRAILAPAPAIPPSLWAEFTLDDASAVVEHEAWYYNDVTPPAGIHWSDEEIASYIATAAAKTPAYYGYTDGLLYAALDAADPGLFRGASVVVMGSIHPLYEAVALQRGAASVTTVEYGPRSLDTPSVYPLAVTTPDAFRDALSGSGNCSYAGPTRFDVGISISSFEHDGLSRYGDPLSGGADLAIMGAMAELVKPGGYLLLALPRGADTIVGTAHRIYGPRRWPALTAGWEVVLESGTRDLRLRAEDAAPTPIDELPWQAQYQPVYLLRNLRGL